MECPGASASNSNGEENGSTVPKSNYVPISDLLQQDPILNSQRRKDEKEDDDDSLDEGWKMTPEMMTVMDKSDWLRAELADGGLRQVIHSIVTSSDRVERNGRTQQEAQLALLKQKYPNFSTFCDKLLTLTGVLERQQPINADGEEEELEPMEEWLQQSHTREELQQGLAIKPIPRKTIPKFEKVDQGTSSDEESEDDENDDDDDDDSSSSAQESGDSRSSDEESSEDDE